MRSYPRNSPQAAARILALAMLSDGHLTMRELDVLDRLNAPAQLGLGRADLHAVLHGFCDDLLATRVRHEAPVFGPTSALHPNQINSLPAESMNFV